MPSQALQRVSIRWCPEPSYEDTDTVALNVGGYFLDLRVDKNSSTVQWSRAGERVALKSEPPTFQWTHIIDSLGLTVPDEAYFKKLPNGDDLEIGTTACPHKEGAMSDYEEVWRDIMSKSSASEVSWILQSTDRGSFIGRVGCIYLSMRQTSDGAFAVRREDFDAHSNGWRILFSAGDVETLPRAMQAIESVENPHQRWSEGQVLAISETEYVLRAIDYQ